MFIQLVLFRVLLTKFSDDYARNLDILTYVYLVLSRPKI